MLGMINWNGKLWFVADDVAKLLGYKRLASMTKRFKGKEKMLVKFACTFDSYNSPTVLLLNEEGLRLILSSSRHPIAKLFRANSPNGKCTLKKLSLVHNFLKQGISYVYFIQSEQTGAIKIGVSTSPKDRLATLQTGSSDNLCLLGSTPGDIALEKQLHLKFSRYSIGGEWFELNEELIALIKKVCK